MSKAVYLQYYSNRSDTLWCFCKPLKLDLEFTLKVIVPIYVTCKNSRFKWISHVVWNTKFLLYPLQQSCRVLCFRPVRPSVRPSVYPSPCPQNNVIALAFVFLGPISKIFHRFTLSAINLIKFDFGWNPTNVNVTAASYSNKFSYLFKWRRHRSSILVFWSDFKNILKIYFMGD